MLNVIRIACCIFMGHIAGLALFMLYGIHIPIIEININRFHLMNISVAKNALQAINAIGEDPQIHKDLKFITKLAFSDTNRYKYKNLPTEIYIYSRNITATVIHLWYSIFPVSSVTPAPREILQTVIESHGRHKYDANGILIMWGQITCLAILTIWARGVGPRFRPDQLSDLTWKDLLIILLGILILIMSFIN